jgi:hypothetical protein
MPAPSAVAWFTCGALLAGGFGTRAAAPDFVRDIQPILERHCHGCHGAERQRADLRLDVKAAALAGSVNGPVIVPGDSRSSRLIELVSGLDPEVRMPKEGGPLSGAQVALLRAWVDAGAVWPDGVDTAEYKDKLDHWSFQPVVHPEPPRVRQAARVRNPIDAFILARLEREGLALSPEADRRTLIRRLHFNLHGLPPAPEEVDAFVRDESPGAYEALVDRLLASPRHGERWARHWLDIIAFGETHGFEVNTPRDNAWPYRDYVIRALNEDKPYSEFIRDQLAGDRTGEDAATGFIVAAAALLPGQIGKDEESKLLARQDELNEMVLGAGSAFLGLTINCARCHDHKFDPISQADYFALQAMFAGVRHGERPLRGADDAARKAEAARLHAQLRELDAQLSHFEPLANPAIGPVRETSPQWNEERFPPAEAELVRFTIHDANLHPTLGLIEPCLDELEIFTTGPSPRNVALAAHGASATASGSRTSAKHRLEHLIDGRHGNDRSWMSDTAGRGWVQIELARRERIDRVVWSRDREGKFKDRLPTSYALEVGVRSGEAVEWQRVAGSPPLRPAVHPGLNVERFAPVPARRVRFTVLETSSHEPCLDELEVFTAGDKPQNIALASAGARATASGTYADSELHRLEHLIDGRYGNSRSWISDQAGRGWVTVEFPAAGTISKIVWARDREGQYADRLPTRYRIEVAGEDGLWREVASSADRKRYVPGAKPETAITTDGLPPAEQARVVEMLAQRKQLSERIRKLEAAPVVYAGRFETDLPETRRLHRGDPMQPRETIAPGSPARLPARLTLSADAGESDRRLALAAWITDPRNPLTARVLVNRLWQFHFGEGLVSTPSDFGNNGARPTHPELLDWLAAEFQTRGGSLKAMHRLICLSATYRQSSRPDPAAMAADAAGRLLWRYPPRRLEAEAIRDSILSVAGTLDLRMGGPGFSVFEPNDNYVRVYEPKDAFTPADWRRMIYMTKVRMAQDGTFGAFDCPDAGQVQPRRPRSTTPIQALNLFNSPFIHQQAERMAARLAAEAGGDLDAQVRLGFRRAFGRSPDADELAWCRSLAAEHGLATVCRVWFNANEFLFVN